jgi:hypothetical protein
MCLALIEMNVLHSNQMGNSIVTNEMQADHLVTAGRSSQSMPDLKTDEPSSYRISIATAVVALEGSRCASCPTDEGQGVMHPLDRRGRAVGLRRFGGAGLGDRQHRETRGHGSSREMAQVGCEGDATTSAAECRSRTLAAPSTRKGVGKQDDSYQGEPVRDCRRRRSRTAPASKAAVAQAPLFRGGAMPSEQPALSFAAAVLVPT